MSTRRFAPFGLLSAAATMLAACGGETKQAEPTAGPQTTRAEPETEARPTAFGLCMMCHSDVQGKNGLGPSLFGVVGRTSGTAPGYSFSPAMKTAHITWDEATIDRYIQNPREMVPGTKMSFAGLKDAKKRAEITQYLATLK